MEAISLDSFIKSYTECVLSCVMCVPSCLRSKNPSDYVTCIELMRDCSDTCRLASSFVARSSIFAKEICGICAGVCRQCAAECKKHRDNPLCVKCREACEKFAYECELVAVSVH